MADPTDEEKKLQALLDEKLNAKLKELGYDDHAKTVIARTNAEAKANREAKEAAEAEAKQLRDAEAARKAEQDTRRAAEEAERKKAEDEKKTLQERVNGIEKTFADKLTALERAGEKKQQEYLDELKARDAQILMEAVKSSAVKRGIIDEDLVSMLDVSKVPIERGKPSREAIDALIEEHATAKPHLYRSQEELEKERERDEGGRFVRPNPSKNKGDVDYSKLSDADFEAAKERLRTTRV